MTIEKEKIYQHWSNETKIKIKDKEYRVGKMSYGDYFLEPYEESKNLGENDDFVKGTLWLQKVENKPNLLKMED